MNQLHALYKAINHSKVEIGELERSMHGNGNSTQFSVLDTADAMTKNSYYKP